MAFSLLYGGAWGVCRSVFCGASCCSSAEFCFWQAQIITKAMSIETIRFFSYQGLNCNWFSVIASKKTEGQWLVKRNLTLEANRVRLEWLRLFLPERIRRTANLCRMAAIGLSSIRSFVAQSGELLAEMAIWYAQTRCEQSFATERSFSLLPSRTRVIPSEARDLPNAAIEHTS